MDAEYLEMVTQHGVLGNDKDERHREPRNGGKHGVLGMDEHRRPRMSEHGVPGNDKDEQQGVPASNCTGDAIEILET